MFKILATFGTDHLVGTHTGKIGVISQCVMDDEGLRESIQLGLTHVHKDAPYWRAVKLPPARINPSLGYPPNRVVQYEEEMVQPIAWRYGDTIIRAGYSQLTQTWIVWDDNKQLTPNTPK